MSLKFNLSIFSFLWFAFWAVLRNICPSQAHRYIHLPWFLKIKWRRNTLSTHFNLYLDYASERWHKTHRQQCHRSIPCSSCMRAQEAQLSQQVLSVRWMMYTQWSLSFAYQSLRILAFFLFIQPRCIFHFFNVCLFWESTCTHAHKQRRGRERGRQNPEQAQSCQQRARRETRSREITHHLRWNQELDTWRTEPSRRPNLFTYFKAINSVSAGNHFSNLLVHLKPFMYGKWNLNVGGWSENCQYISNTAATASWQDDEFFFFFLLLSRISYREYALPVQLEV